MSKSKIAPLSAGLLYLGCALLATPSLAVGPDEPVRFDTDPEADPWAIRLLVDERHQSALKIEVQVYQNGEPLRVGARALKVSRRQFAATDRDDTLSLRLSLKADELADLKPGVYAQKVVVSTERQDLPSSKPLRLQRWQYFVVKDSRVYSISMERYSALTDPSAIDIGPDDREIPVHVGRAETLPMSLEKTKGSEAIPVGRQSGLRQEEVPADQLDKEAYRQRELEREGRLKIDAEDESDEK